MLIKDIRKSSGYTRDHYWWLREKTTVVSHDMERGQGSFKIDDAEALRKGKVNVNVLIALVKQLLAYRIVVQAPTHQTLCALRIGII